MDKTREDWYRSRNPLFTGRTMPPSGQELPLHKKPEIGSFNIVSGAAPVQIATSRSSCRGVRTASAKILFSGAPASFERTPHTFLFAARRIKPLLLNKGPRQPL